MISALSKLDPHCPKCLVEAKIGDPPRPLERDDFTIGVPGFDPLEQRTVHCWNCGNDYTARFYEPQGE